MLFFYSQQIQISTQSPSQQIWDSMVMNFRTTVDSHRPAISYARTLQRSWTSRHGNPALRVSLICYPIHQSNANPSDGCQSHPPAIRKIYHHLPAPNTGPTLEQAPKPSTFPSAKLYARFCKGKGDDQYMSPRHSDVEPVEWM